MALGEHQKAANEPKKPDLSATGVVKLAKEYLTLFRTPGREPFARVFVKQHYETYRIRSLAFEEWLSVMCYQQYGVVPGQRAVKQAASVLAADATITGTEQEAYVRVGSYHTTVYIDLANNSRESIRITRAGWEIVPHAPINFWRPPGMLPLPHPIAGGRIADLRPFINSADDDQWILTESWLVGALRPNGPRPVLILEGAHGSGKSTTAKILRALIDPNVSPLRAEPANTRDLMISANNSWVLGYDNISHLGPSLSDALCRLCTGGGFSTRALYTDDGEKIFEGTRPVLLNGIDMGIDRLDLLDRAISLTLPSINENTRETEAKVLKRFEQARPYILGSLLDAVACALRRASEVRLECLPRMADFATWICAATPALGWTEKEFLEAYAKNRMASNALGLEASPLVELIKRIAARGPWQGTATALITELVEEELNDSPGVQRIFPRTPRRLSQELRRLIPGLAEIGIAIEFVRTPGVNSQRLISIRKTGDAGDAATQHS